MNMRRQLRVHAARSRIVLLGGCCVCSISDANAAVVRWDAAAVTMSPEVQRVKSTDDVPRVIACTTVPCSLLWGQF